MKIELAAVSFLIVCSFLSATTSTFSPNVVPLRKSQQQQQQQQLVKEEAVTKDCELCLSFSEEYLKYLLEAVSTTTVTGSCAGICELVEKKVKKKYVEYICLSLCGAVGVATFVAIVEEAKVDPFYFCDLIRLCPEKDDGDAEILSLSTDPNPVKKNSSWVVKMYFKTKEGTGLGQIDLSVTRASDEKIVHNDDQQVDPLGPGEWLVTWSYPSFQWGGAGNYTLHVALCYGECWSHAPHSKVYDTHSTNFTVIG